MDMLYFGDSVPYSYQTPYKQGFGYNHGEFNNSCAYQSVGMGLSDMAACRYSSIPAMSSAYGMYAFQQANCANLFARKAGRIKGIYKTFYHILKFKS
jgi:hypothetical protein